MKPAKTAAPVRVLIVDDHPVFRRGLVELINEAPDLTVCAEAETAAGALAAAKTRQPDVAMVDLSLGHESGLDLIASLVASQPDVRVLVVSGHDERVYADRALTAGALGYVMKDQPAEELLTAVRRVASGKPYVSVDTADRILSTMGTSRRTAVRSPVDRLSNRERHVLTLVGRGLATREVAAQLQLSIKTVESHLAHIKQKLGVRNSRELMRIAVTWIERDTV